jgi:predicted nuclease of predicted toxin-antitoxin system
MGDGGECGMKFLLDMNLSPAWIETLAEGGWSAVHWRMVGDPAATDATIMAWAVTHGYVVFTHDLDFGTALAATKATAPTVIQIRTQDTMPHTWGSRLLQFLAEHTAVIERGALITIDERKARIRILPFPNS